jgi:hypothetical protein
MVKDSINVDVVDEKEETYIHGASEVYPYDVKTYEIRNYQWKAGTWSVENESRSGIVKMTDIESNKVTLNIVTGRSGAFTLAYKVDGQVIASLDITIGSL